MCASGQQFATVDLVGVQRRTLRVLFATEIIGGIGVGMGGSVGALLAAELAGTSVSGLSQSAAVIGAAVLAFPATEIVNRRGRRPSLAASYVAAALGSIVIVIAAKGASALPLLLGGFFLFGGAIAAGLQARYAAVALAPAALRARHLSMIVWGATLGAVAGPNLAALAGASLDDYGIPVLAVPFVFSALLFSLAAVVLILMMRPDPANMARRGAAQSPESAPALAHIGMGAASMAVA